MEVVQKKSVSGILKGLYNSIHRRLGKEDKRKFEELMEILERPQSLPVSSLSISEIEQIFGIKRDKSQDLWTLDEKSLEPVPEINFGSNGPRPRNEACCRMRVDAILIECIGLEQDRAKLNEEHALTPISLTAESALQLEVKLQRQKRLLSGRADYSLWYDDHTLGTNLVIVKAKRRILNGTPNRGREPRQEGGGKLDSAAANPTGGEELPHRLF
ncbi:hypothetical protein V8E54_013970 [Elaphomyces granulatus]